jgi:hypothetical protein
MELFDGTVVIFICAENRKNRPILSSKLPKAIAVGAALFYANPILETNAGQQPGDVHTA